MNNINMDYRTLTNEYTEFALSVVKKKENREDIVMPKGKIRIKVENGKVVGLSNNIIELSKRDFVIQISFKGGSKGIDVDIIDEDEFKKKYSDDINDWECRSIKNRK